MLDLLSSLVEKSLVQAEPAGSGTRYRLLESTRQYAREKLIECGQEEALARAHALAYLDLAEQFEHDWETMPDRAWLAQAEPELENWRAALEWALTSGCDLVVGQRLVGALRRAWWSFSAAEGRRWVRAALEAVDAATPAAVVAKLDLTEAELNVALSQYKASYAAAERALVRYRALEDALGAAAAQQCGGLALVFLGRISEGEALLLAALGATRALRARKLSGWVLQYLAYARHFAGDVAGARAHYAAALAIYKAIGAERLAAQIACSLAEAEFRGGDAATAMRLAGEALAADRARNYTRSVATDVCNMAAYLLALNRYDEARSHAREALALSRDLQAEVLVAFTLQHLAAVAASRPDDEVERANDDRVRAARLLGYVDTRLTTLEALRVYTEQQEYDKMLAALRDTLGADDLAKLMDEGREWSEDQAVVEALHV